MRGGRVEVASMIPPSVRVFISYAHESRAHVNAVRKLWILLRRHGVDAQIDLVAAERRRDWTLWMQEQVEKADHVLVIASPAYKKRAGYEANPHAGRGVQYEARLIRQLYYADQSAMHRFLPVVLPNGAANDVPDFLTPETAQVYTVEEFTLAGVETLLRVFTRQPREIQPELGPLPTLPPRSHVIDEAEPDNEEKNADRSQLVSWLTRSWPTSGPCTFCLQGLPGVGKTHMAEVVLDSNAFKSAVLVEVPAGYTSPNEVLLLVVEALDRDLDLRVPIGSDLVTSLLDIMRSPILVVIDEFQNCLERGGIIPEEFRNLISGLRRPRHPGRLLLLSSQGVDEEVLDDKIRVRTLGGLEGREGQRVLGETLQAAGRLDEVPHDLFPDVVSWLGGNPRAMRALAVALKRFELEDLIDFEPEAWEHRNQRLSPQLLALLEKQLLQKSFDTATPELRSYATQLAVYRRSVKFDGVEAVVGPHKARAAVDDLLDSFFLERRRNYYSMNAVVREVSLTGGEEAESALRISAHRAAAAYYMRPFLAKRTTASRNATNFLEVRHHLAMVHDQSRFNDVAKLYALHLQRVYHKATRVPQSKADVQQQIMTLQAALSGGSPSAELNYYLAKLLLARAEEGDRTRAVEEIVEASRFPDFPLEALHLLIDLDEFVRVRILLDGFPSSHALSQVYIKLAEKLRALGEHHDAIDALLLGIDGLSPEHNVTTIYAMVGPLLRKAGRRTEAIELLSRGIERLRPADNVAMLYTALSSVFAAEQEFDRAVALLHTGIDRLGTSNNVDKLYAALTDLLITTDRSAQAVELLLTAIDQLDPTRGVGQLYVRLSRLLNAADRVDEAVKLLQGAVERLPGVPETVVIYSSLSKMLVVEQRRDLAMTYLQQGITRLGKSGDIASLYLALSRLLRQEERHDEALTLLDSGVAELIPEQRVVLLYLRKGQLLVAMGRTEAAVATMQSGINRLRRVQSVRYLYAAIGKHLCSTGRLHEAIELVQDWLVRPGTKGDQSYLQTLLSAFAEGREPTWDHSTSRRDQRALDERDDDQEANRSMAYDPADDPADDDADDDADDLIG